MNREAELNDQDRKNIEKGSQKLAEEFKELENSLESFYKDILPETQEIYKKMFFLKGASNSGRWSWGTWWNLIDVKGGFHIGIDIFNKYTGDQERISVDTRSIVLNTDTFKQFLFSQGIEWKSTSLIIHTIFFDIKDKYNSFINRIQYIDSIKRELQEKNQKVKKLTLWILSKKVNLHLV